MNNQSLYNKFVGGSTSLQPREIRQLINALNIERQQHEDFTKRARGEHFNPLESIKGFAVLMQDDSIGYFYFNKINMDFLDLTKFKDWCTI